MSKDAWKSRAWAASRAMHSAEQCRTIDDIRRVLLNARLELEAYFVMDRHECEATRDIPDTDDLETLAAEIALLDSSISDK